MDQKVFVPLQGILTAATAIGALLLTGHRCALAIAIILSVGALIWIGFMTAYYIRSTREKRRSREERDSRAVVNAAIGFLLPASMETVIWATGDFDGLLFSSAAAAFTGATLTLILTAILTSSMVDWYLILPAALGLLGADRTPIWEPDHGETDRKRISQYWIAHRGICEFFVFPSIAVVAAVGLVALGDAVSSDHTLPRAFESLGGAGIAFGLVSYAGPRYAGAVGFVLSSPVGLGMWVAGEDERGKPIRGLVADVSVSPGIKLIDYVEGEPLGRRGFLPLSESDQLHEAQPPPEVDRQWIDKMMRLHLAKDPQKQQKKVRKQEERADRERAVLGA